MFHTIHGFVKTMKGELEITEKLISTITDSSLSTELIPGYRTIGQLLWHIIGTPAEMLGHTGLKVVDPTHGAKYPHSIQKISEEFRRVMDSTIEQVQKNWTDETLQQKDNMYGEQWKRGFTLEALHLHLVHHRGQLTVLMRLAGLPVSGVYGPSREEWKNLGMKPPQE